MSEEDLPDFVHTLASGPPGTEIIEDVLELEPEVEQELRRRLKEIADCRRAAMASAHNYWIG